MSKKYKYDAVVFIGRFQPFHNGHLDVVKYALTISEKIIIVLGSHNKAPSIRDPLDSDERYRIIVKAIGDHYYPKEKKIFEGNRIQFVYQADHTYNMDRWTASIQTAVDNISRKGDSWVDVPKKKKIGIIGYDKDHTSFYLKSFPQWETVPYEIIDSMDATTIRRILYNKHISIKDKEENIKDLVTNPLTMIDWFERKPELAKENQIIDDYKKSWGLSPYPPIFQTVDAVVTQSGHILLVQRKASPGKGQWAFPGGFINPNETLEQAVLRELKEETKIDVPLPALRGSIAKVHTFDDPERSVRGRTITTAYHIKLNDQEKLPKIKAASDAANCKWVTFNEFAQMRNQMFEDHYCISEYLIGI